MTDLERVLQGLDCVSGFGHCLQSEAFAGGICAYCIKEIAKKAKELLKEQESVEPAKWIYPTDLDGFGRCPHCNSLWDYSLISNRFFKHCPRCGKTVKWDDRQSCCN